MNRVGGVVVGIGCVYELVALATGRVPTITAIVKATARRRFGRFLLWLWIGFVVDHFIEREVA